MWPAPLDHHLYTCVSVCRGLSVSVGVRRCQRRCPLLPGITLTQSAPLRPSPDIMFTLSTLALDSPPQKTWVNTQGRARGETGQCPRPHSPLQDTPDGVWYRGRKAPKIEPLHAHVDRDHFGLKLSHIYTMSMPLPAASWVYTRVPSTCNDNHTGGDTEPATIRCWRHCAGQRGRQAKGGTGQGPRGTQAQGDTSLCTHHGRCNWTHVPGPGLRYNKAQEHVYEAGVDTIYSDNQAHPTWIGSPHQTRQTVLFSAISSLTSLLHLSAK